MINNQTRRESAEEEESLSEAHTIELPLVAKAVVEDTTSRRERIARIIVK